MIDNKQAEIVIVTGMSGAGKTVAMHSFEDLGYYCVDNLPPTLLPMFLDLMRGSEGIYNKVAVVMDLRARDFFDDLIDVIQKLRASKEINVSILFLDAENEKLVQRYKETRRTHPLAPQDLPLKGVKMERELLAQLRAMANYTLQTSQYKPKDLREKIIEQFSEGKAGKFQIVATSFGFKHGIPIDADLVFDVRFLPNPFYIEEMRPMTGLDEMVFSYVLKWDESKIFIEKLIDLLEFMVPQYKKEGKSQLVIAIGCTGGQHRSVTIAEELYKHFSKTQVCQVSHRDIQKKKVTLHD